MKIFLKGPMVIMAAVVLLAIMVGVFGALQEGGTEIAFTQEQFSEVRQPLPLTPQTPHGQIAKEHLQLLNDNFYNRMSFSYQELYTAVWIVEELLAMGYDWEDIEIQEYGLAEVEVFCVPGIPTDIIIFTSNGLTLDRTPFFDFGLRESRLSQNIILTIPGQSEQTIVIGAHYDTVMVPGANDNGSGTALLLESAQRMFEVDNYYTLVYVFFGAEEVGLLGAIHYVNSLSPEDHDNLLFMLNADFLLGGHGLFYMAGVDLGGRSGANHITETWDQIAAEMYSRHGLTFIPWPSGVFGTSDHLAFMPFGHTIMFMAGLEAVEGWNDYDPDYLMLTFIQMARAFHSPQDNLDYINNQWPGKTEHNMHAFSLFLEELLLASYDEGGN